MKTQTKEVKDENIVLTHALFWGIGLLMGFITSGLITLIVKGKECLA